MFNKHCPHCGKFQSSQQIMFADLTRHTMVTRYPCGLWEIETYWVDGQYRMEVPAKHRCETTIPTLPDDKLSQDELPF